MRRLPRRPDASATRPSRCGASRVGGAPPRRGSERRRRSLSRSAAGWESLLGDRPVGPARWALDRRAREAVAGDARRGGGRRRDRGAGARVDGCRAQRAARRARPARLPRGPDRARACVLPGVQRVCDPARRPRASRSSSAIPTCGESSRCGRRSRPRSTRQRRRSSATSPAGGAPIVGIPGFSGAGVTVALLDTGVDLVHPYIRACAPARASTCSIPAATPAPARTRRRPGGPSATAPRWRASSPAREAPPASRASPPARRCCRSGSRAGSRTRPAGSRSTAGPISSSPGIELAVDPNEDGDAHDAARVALVGVVEPFAAFTDGPLAAAAAGASALDSLVVAPAGNDGPAGPAYGSVGGPGRRARRPHGRRDRHRRRSPTGHVLLLAGLRVARLRRPAARRRRRSVASPVSAPVVALAPRRAGRRRRARAASRRLFDSDGLQPGRGRGGAAPARDLVAGGRPRGRRGRCARRARRRAAAGRVARDRRPGRGADPRAVRERMPMPSGRRSGARSRSRLAVGAAAFDTNDGLGDAAPFSSEGLAFDGGPKPEVSAAGIGLATSDPGRERGRRRPLRHAQRLERGGGAHRRRGSAARRRRGPTSTQPA